MPPATIAAYIGGVEATVGYAGLAPQLAGLYQINLTVPTGVTAGDNNLDIAGPDAYSSVCLIAIGGATPGLRRRRLTAYRTRAARPARGAALESQSLDDRLHVGGAHAHVVLHLSPGPERSSKAWNSAILAIA